MEKYLVAILIFLTIDSIWLLTGGIYARELVQRIQGSPIRIRYMSALIVYLAMSYLIYQAKDFWHAVALGTATYAVYDFTTHALLTNYDWRFALADTVWGGILFGLTHLALVSFGYKN